jgi:hypothetical protein
MSIPAGDREVMVPAWDGETANCQPWLKQPTNSQTLVSQAAMTFFVFPHLTLVTYIPNRPNSFWLHKNYQKWPPPQRRIAQVHDTGHVALHFINLRPCRHVPVSRDDTMILGTPPEAGKWMKIGEVAKSHG